MKQDQTQQLGTALIGVALGITISSIWLFPQNLTLSQEGNITNDSSQMGEISSHQETTFHESDSITLMETAFSVVKALEMRDSSTLAALVHPEEGVRFTPFSTINKETDVTLSPKQLSDLLSDQTLYQWGTYPTTGEPISLSISDYFQRFVTPLHYSKAPNIISDCILVTGNALENISEVYCDGERFVDFTFRGIDPTLNGADWSSLKLVFQPQEENWLLVGIVHSELTV